MEQASFASWLRQAMVDAGFRTEELAKAVGVSRVTVSNWRNGVIPDEHRLPALLKVLAAKGVKIPVDIRAARVRLDLPGRVVRETPAPRADMEPGWPEGWRARTYRLVLEATEKGATEEELTVVRSWMLNPQLQALWAGGAPSDDRLGELDGIEIGTRAWLIKRGRKVKAR